MTVKETAPIYRSPKRVYTYQDYLEMPEDGHHYEIINGELLMTPAPITLHQKISLKIVELFLQFLRNNPIGELFYAPVDVVFSEIHVVQPDIFFILKERADLITEKNISGAPDLVIEIISPTSAYYDLIEKKEIYEKFGVREYWIVDPKKHRLEIYLNEDGKFRLKQRAERSGAANSIILNGLAIQLDRIFDLK